MKNKTLTRIARSNNRSNRTRSLLVVFSVFLTTLLLAAIGTFGYGVIQDNRVNSGNRYGHSYGAIKAAKPEQVLEMRRRSEFTDLGFMIQAGIVENEKSQNLIWFDETCGRLSNMDAQLKEGKWPEKETEIAAQPAFFRSLGYEEPEIGMEVTFRCRPDLNRPYREETFVISGLLWELDFGLESGTYTAGVSEAFLNRFSGEQERDFNVLFRIGSQVKLNQDNAEQVITELAADCGIEEWQVSVNKEYLHWRLDPGFETISGCIMIALLVILFSALVIYNIFQVGIVDKIQEYGKLKALGATRRQLKKVVFREGMILAAIGIPAGLAAGWVIASVSFSWIMKESNAVRPELGYTTVSLFSAPVLLLVAAAALLTVWAALKKPMRIVAMISPVEAMRYQEANGRKKKRGDSGRRKGKQAMTVWNLTIANLSANRSRNLVTIATMGLSCVLFVVMANFVGNMDVDYDARQTVEYGQFRISLDYSLEDTAYPENNLDQVLTDNPLDDGMVERLAALPGVTEVRTSNVLALWMDGELDFVGVLNQEDFKKQMESAGRIGDFDYETVSEQNALVLGWYVNMRNGEIKQGQQMDVILSDGSKTVSFTPSVAGSFGLTDQNWNITEDTRDHLGFSEASTGVIWVDCEKSDRERVEEEIRKLFDGVEHVDLETLEEARKLSELGIRLLALLVYSVLALLGLAGFLNLANTMIIGIVTRKKEFGALQAIGMTKRQMNFSLQTEGLLFTAGTLLVALAAGIPGGYALFCYGKSRGLIGLNEYQFPFTEVGIMAAVLLLLQLVLSFFLSRNMRKESPVERIRYQG